MSRLFISTRGIGSWRERLASRDRHWKRGYSAFETAVAWELAKSLPSGLPAAVEDLFRAGDFDLPVLLLAVAEHQVELAGRGKESQCDVWGLVQTSHGLVSLSVEAKVQESFGNHSLADWLKAGKSEKSGANRLVRWDCIREHLPTAAPGVYDAVPYQLLHRCAAAVIEARRCGCQHAAFVVQSFGSPPDRFDEFNRFCTAIAVSTKPGSPVRSQVGSVQLLVGWADCPFATDKQVAATA